MSKAAEERRKEKEAATLAQLAAQEKRAEEVRPAFLSFHDQDDQDGQDDDAHVRVISFSIIVLKENSLLALFEKSNRHLIQTLLAVPPLSHWYSDAMFYAVMLLSWINRRKYLCL